jgi:hypothetical protein
VKSTGCESRNYWMRNNSRLKAFNAGKVKLSILKTEKLHSQISGTSKIWIWMKMLIAFFRI